MNAEQPEPTEEEHEQAHSGRQREEDDMRGAIDRSEVASRSPPVD